MFDYLIVGAGFAGSVLAERLARVLDKKVLIIDVSVQVQPVVFADTIDHNRVWSMVASRGATA